MFNYVRETDYETTLQRYAGKIVSLKQYDNGIKAYSVWLDWLTLGNDTYTVRHKQFTVSDINYMTLHGKNLFVTLHSR